MDEVSALRAQLSEYQARDRAQAIDGALAGAIAGAGVTLRPGVEDQVRALLKPDVAEATCGDQRILCGPGLKDLNSFVRDQLASDRFKHFVAEGSGPAPGAKSQPAGPMSALGAVSQGLSLMSGVGRGPAQPGESLGERVVAAQQARTAAAGDPRYNPALPMGLKARA